MVISRPRAALFLAALVLPAALVAQQVEPAGASAFVSLSASGEVRAVPDRARVLLSVQTRAPSAADAAAQNAQKQTAVIAALRSMGIPTADISTENYSITPETRLDRTDAAPRIVSYRVSNALLVEVSDLSMVGKLIDSALGAGANEVSSVDFFESNAEELYQKALSAAMTTAKREAESIAAAAGGHLGPLVDVSSGGRPVISPFMRAGRMAAASVADTPIMPGQETVDATVSCRWIFVPGR